MIPRMIAVGLFLSLPAALWAQSREDVQAQKQAVEERIARLRVVPLEFARILLMPVEAHANNPSRSEAVAHAQRHRNAVKARLARANADHQQALASRSDAQKSAALRALVHVQILGAALADAEQDVRVLNDEVAEDGQAIIDRKMSLSQKTSNLLDLDLWLLR